VLDDKINSILPLDMSRGMSNGKIELILSSNNMVKLLLGSPAGAENAIAADTSRSTQQGERAQTGMHMPRIRQARTIWCHRISDRSA
jgi:hypothetical protein